MLDKWKKILEKSGNSVSPEKSGNHDSYPGSLYAPKNANKSINVTCSTPQVYRILFLVGRIRKMMCRLDCLHY